MSEENCSFCGGEISNFEYPNGVLGSIDTSSIPKEDWVYHDGPGFDNMGNFRPRFWEIPDSGMSLVDFRGGCLHNIVAVSNECRSRFISSLSIENTESKEECTIKKLEVKKPVEKIEEEEEISYCGKTG